MSDPAKDQASAPAPEPAEASETGRVDATDVEPTDAPADAAAEAADATETPAPADEQPTDEPAAAQQPDDPAEQATDETAADTATSAEETAPGVAEPVTDVAPAEPTDAPTAEAQGPETPPTDDPAPAADAAAETEPVVEEAAAETEPVVEEAAAETEAAAAPKPAAPRPGPRPKPSAVPHPPRKPAPAAAGSPAAPASVPEVPAVPALADDSAAAKAAAEFGRVDEDGTVYVRESAGERSVGQFPGVDTEEALALYVRRYLDLQAKVALFEARLTSTDLSVKEIDQTITRLTEETAEPSAVGDLDGLRAQVEALRGAAAERRGQLEAERATAKAAALEARTEIIEAAEKIAATDPSRMQWRPAGEELRGLLDRWKEAQRSGPRIDRTSEEALWKRFSHARTAFDRERRHYFAELEQRNASAKTAKEKLVAEAEALSSSTDWGPTAGAYRDLMARWKAAGRASRKDDDALWARFRAAQDTFFQARDAANSATDAEYAANLEVKEALLAEAEKLVPVKNLGAAKAALRDLQERWEEAGRVPRGDLQRVEGRLRAVENAVRDAEQAQWTRTNPETRARAEGAAAQLESAIEGLEADLAAAQSRGDARAVKDLETALTARRAWLEQVVRAAEDSRG
ncbi:hypothetical protein JOE63_002305 [Cellulosimicrobium cellulans]|uniref:DUF349 domain-containing protein n=1 Tax=Cellulosimicrobium cellulans TaxID=1710 RepID=A0A1Y0I0J1_CELCE|nr:DUF349 domain-containing protein [Cellulosimicrobium cellulans]ARU53055.1 hypothetical protein CBR64_18050 [Cellulosimicrobium cellulans]MBM7819828.1 hypothetical protein [Cellulosimicrobium cellulans]